MSTDREMILATLSRIALPDGGDLVSRDMVRALTVDGANVRFVLEVADPDIARRMEPTRQAAEAAVRAIPGVASVSVVLTAHGPAPKPSAPPTLKIGGHPTPQAGPQRVAGVDRILAVASGKGGVGKSTTTFNLALGFQAIGRRADHPRAVVDRERHLADRRDRGHALRYPARPAAVDNSGERSGQDATDRIADPAKPPGRALPKRGSCEEFDPPFLQNGAMGSM